MSEQSAAIQHKMVIRKSKCMSCRASKRSNLAVNVSQIMVINVSQIIVLVKSIARFVHLR